VKKEEGPAVYEKMSENLNAVEATDYFWYLELTTEGERAADETTFESRDLGKELIVISGSPSSSSGR